MNMFTKGTAPPANTVVLLDQVCACAVLACVCLLLWLRVCACICWRVPVQRHCFEVCDCILLFVNMCACMHVCGWCGVYVLCVVRACFFFFVCACACACVMLACPCKCNCILMCNCVALCAHACVCIARQVPGHIHYGDITSAMMEQGGYWASYNIPYYQDIFNVSGCQQLVQQYGDWFTYDKHPRALMFARNHGNVRAVLFYASCCQGVAGCV